MLFRSQAAKVAESGAGLEVWSKPLSAPGHRAVLLLNRTGSPASITVRWSDLGLLDSSPATVRDLWARKDLGAFHSSYSATVPAGDAAMLLVHGSEGRLITYKAAGAGKQLAGSVTVQRAQPLSFTHVAATARVARIQIAYTNPDKAPRFAELRVNGQLATRIAFPPTGIVNATGTIWIQSLLDRTGAENVLTFSTPCDPGPGIESISVE